MADEAQAHAMLFQLTGVGVVQTDMATGRFVRVNETFCEMVGYSQAELQGMTNAQLTHPEDWTRDAESFRALQRGESQRNTSLTRCIRKDGQVAWLELHITVMGGGDEAVNLTLVNDVTESTQATVERARAEEALHHLNHTLEQRVEERTEALRHSEQRFSQAFYSNPIPACMTTFGRETFVEVNAAFLALTGYEHDEVVGHSSRELQMWSSPEDQKELGEVQRDGKGFRNLELRLRIKDGGIRHILLSAAVIHIDGEEGYLKMFYDITERKQTEEELHQAIQEVMTDAGWFSHKLMERLANIRSGRTKKPEVVELSKRERQVLERMARGMNNSAIATELDLKAQTVRNYITAIYEKLGVHSRVEAVVWARERGVVGS